MIQIYLPYQHTIEHSTQTAHSSMLTTYVSEEYSHASLFVRPHKFQGYKEWNQT